MEHVNTRIGTPSIPLDRVRLGAGALLRRLQHWHERSRQRRQLLELDERLYRDIGVTAEEAWQEAGKPFWRD